jgi:hypothetical protein
MGFLLPFTLGAALAASPALPAGAQTTVLGDSLASVQREVLAGAIEWPKYIQWPTWLYGARPGDGLPSILANGGDRAEQQAVRIYGLAPQVGQRFAYLAGRNNQAFAIFNPDTADSSGSVLFKQVVLADAYWLAGKKRTAQQIGCPPNWAPYVPGIHPWPGVGCYSVTAGAPFPATFTGDELVVGYATADGVFSALNITVDGVLVPGSPFSLAPPRYVGTFSVFGQTFGQIPGVIVRAGFGAGAHAVEFKPANGGVTMLDFVGDGPSGNHVYLMNLPETANPYYASTPSYVAAIDSIVNQMAPKGYKVHKVDVHAIVQLPGMCVDSQADQAGAIHICGGNRAVAEELERQIAQE